MCESLEQIEIQRNKLCTVKSREQIAIRGNSFVNQRSNCNSREQIVSIKGMNYTRVIIRGNELHNSLKRFTFVSINGKSFWNFRGLIKVHTQGKF